MRLALFCGIYPLLLLAADPTLGDVRYGPYERHVLDFYQAGPGGPSPVLIFFHGGGFRGGDKRSFRDNAGAYLKAGIAVVSANYRLSSQAIYPAPMLDGARVVQFVRSKAREWNLDPAKVAVSGSSAGGTLALWIALHEDLAKPSSGDALAGISTRVACATTKVAPTSMDPLLITKVFGSTDFGAMLALHGVRTLEEFSAPDARRRALDASPLQHATRDDPPLFLQYGGDLTTTPLPAGSRFRDWIHHARFGELLKHKCDELGLECHYYHRGSPAPDNAEIEFLRRCFARAAKSTAY
jgi:acetyl esterase/lipase